MKILNIIKNNVKLYMIIAIIILLGTVGVTLAVTISGFNAIAINTISSDIDVNISYDDGANTSEVINNGNMLPISDSLVDINTNDARVLKVKFNVSGAQNNPDNTIYDVAMYFDELDCELRTSDLKWRLYKNDTLLNEGSLSPTFDTINNNRLVLTNTQEDLTSTEDKYTFLLWISEACTGDITECDSSMDQSKYLNKVLNGNIKIELSTKSKKEINRVTGEEGSCNYMEKQVPLCNNLTYNANSQTLINASDYYKVTNNTGINAGSYAVTLDLEDGYKWNDGSTGKRVVTCNIDKYDVELATLNQSIKYGESITNSLNYISIGNLIKGHSLSNYKLVPSIYDVGVGTISVNNPIIIDSAGNNVTSNYNIKYKKGEVTVNCLNIASLPNVSDKEYTGEELIGVSGGEYINVTGNKSATRVGTYSVNVTPQKNYCFEDNTTDAKILEWKIIGNVVVINLNSNGSDSDGSSIIYSSDGSVCLDEACTQIMNTTSNNITIPEKNGYTFAGYYTNSDGTGTMMINSDGYATEDLLNIDYNEEVTLYAKWVVDEYTIIYDLEGGDLLPDDYVPVEYIESSGTQYIDTGISRSYNDDITFTIELLYNRIDVENQIMGFTGNKGMGFGTEGADWWKWWSGTDSVAFEANKMYDFKYNIKGRSAYLSINGDEKTITTNSSLDLYAGNIYLFAAAYSYDYPDDIRYHTHTKVYTAQIYVNGVVVRDFIPCYRKSDNVVGLYDRINNVFYTNGGTGTFVAGPSVNEYTMFKDTFKLPTPAKKGYSFEGWYTSSNFTGSALTEIESGNYGDKVLYAKWSPITFTINYNLDGGSVTSNPTSYTIESSDIILNSPTKEGYTFVGWQDNQDLIKPDIISTDGSFVISGNTFTITNLTSGNAFSSFNMQLWNDSYSFISEIKQAQLGKTVESFVHTNETGYYKIRFKTNGSTKDSDYYIRVYLVNGVRYKYEWNVITASSDKYVVEDVRFYSEDGANTGIPTNVISTGSYGNRELTAIWRDSNPPTVNNFAGKILYDDPEFASGTNGTSVYNNSDNGNVTVTRKAISGVPNSSGYGLEIVTSGEASPDHGGFYFGNYSQGANHEFVTRIIAKIPIGYSIVWRSNAVGDNWTSRWLTNNVGTGDWEEYVYYLKTGSTGTFAGTNYFYLSGGSAPVTWQVAYATVIHGTNDVKDYIISVGSDLETGIVGKAYTTSSSEPSSWTSVSNKSYSSLGISVPSSGTYYTWYKDGGGNIGSSSVGISSTIYTISYDANGGSGAPSAQTYAYASSGTTNLSNVTPTREGYTFLGWSTDKNATSASYSAGQAWGLNNASNCTLYAVWQLNTYTVTQYHYYYYQNTEWIHFNTTTDSVSHGSSFTPYNVTPQEGYHAGNIYDYYDESYNHISGGTGGFNSFTVNQNMYVHVHYYPDTYSVCFNANGGSGAPDCVTKTNSIALTLPSTTPSRTGYTFLGWSTDSGASSATYGAGGSYTANAGATLYAVWRVNSYTYNIVHKSSTGTSLGSGTVAYNYGTTNTIHPSSFTGYNSPSSQSIVWDSVSAKTITFTYTPVSYSITYNLNGGSLSNSNPSSYTIETSSFTLYNPSKSGHSFSGWTGSNGNSPSTSVTIAKGSTGNKSYTANYVDVVAPTCSLSVSTSGVTMTKSDNVGVTSYGMSTSSSATYNGSTSLGLSAGTKYGFVADAAGNTGSCSVNIIGTTSNTSMTGSDTTVACNSSNYSNPSGNCPSGYGYVTNNCSSSSTPATYKGDTYNCIANTYWMQCICENGDTPPASDENECAEMCVLYGSSMSSHSFDTTYNWVYAESFGALPPEYCTTYNIQTCDAAYFNTYTAAQRETYRKRNCTVNSYSYSYSGNITCKGYVTTYSCSTGTKINDSYCYYY